MNINKTQSGNTMTVAIEGRLASFGIDQAHQRGVVQAEVVAERGVLTEVVGVVGIVIGREGVAGQQDQSRADLLTKRLATRHVGRRCKHSYRF